MKEKRFMFERLKKILVDELSLNPDDVTLSAELTNDLGVNSLELADLVLVCEDEFGVEFNEDDIHKFITVGDVVEYLEENAQ
ncbi:MAG: acyl carrier protein [Clostridia bacterium]|nr:acyl carrier protein [Clostridia bacterium]